MAESGGEPGPLLRSIAVLGNLGGIIFPIGAMALLIVPGIWAYQATSWFEHGSWPAISVADGLGWAGIAAPTFESDTIQQASEDLLDSPLSLALLFGIGGLMFLYAGFSRWLERRCEPEKADNG